MSSETPNPYQAPTADPQQAIRGALADALETRDHVEFAGEITKNDLVFAIRHSALRRDLRSLRRSRLILVIPGAMIVLLCPLLMTRGGSPGVMPVVLIAGLIIVLAYATLMHRWLVARHVKNNSDAIGSVRGRIDRESLRMENEHQVRYRPLAQLVGSDVNRRGWVLCFDPTHTLFEMLPLSGFDDPDTAQILAANLSEARPFSATVPYDSRRLAAPTQQPRFVPGKDAVFYSGELRTEDIEGTPLAKSQSRDRILLTVRLVVTFCLIVGFIAMISFSAVMTFVAGAVLALFVGRALFRIYRAPFAGQADAKLLWRSAGWLDGEAIVSMTAVGQTESRWPAFDCAAITDRAITLRTNSGWLWHLIARRQFPEENDWETACRMVRDHLPSYSP